MVETTPVACLQDNYAYLVANTERGEAVVVDASEAAPVLTAIARKGTKLVGVLSTHHHHDHVGGNLELARAHPGLRIFAHARDAGRVPCQTDSLTDGQEFSSAGMTIQVLHVPGHTLGAIAYRVSRSLFSGDTLFHGGCGRIFEGTPEMLFASLRALTELDGDTRVFPGHEYTLSNLQFAEVMDPENEAVRSRLEATRALRAAGQPTVGATLREELATNPFLRCATPSIRRSLQAPETAEDLQVFAALRRTKDAFRG